MNEIKIEVDGPIEFRVFYDNNDKLFHINAQREDLSIIIDGFVYDELKQLKKEINDMLKRYKLKYMGRGSNENKRIKERT